MSRGDGTPAVQVTVPLNDGVHCWLDTFRDSTPVLAIETGVAEFCLVLASGAVTGTQLRAARELADAATAFAAVVEAQANRAGAAPVPG